MITVKVRDVMKSEYDLIDGMKTVSDALNDMKHQHNKSLIIDKRDPEDEYGMVLISDIAKEVLAKDRSPDRVNVYEIMSKPVISIHPDMKVNYCARLFEKFGLSRAPVIEDKKIIGIVSFTDLVLKGFVSK